MGKLGTAFTPITTPSGSRLLTLIDEATGLRYKINITDFFALVDSVGIFNGQITSKVAGASGLNLESTTDQSTFINFIDQAGDATGRIFYSPATKIMSFRTNSVDRFTISELGDATFFGDALISSASGETGATPPTLRINSTTNSGGWTVGAEVANLDFSTADPSGSGANIPSSSIRMYVGDGVGSKYGLRLMTDDGVAGLTTALELNQNQDATFSGGLTVINLAGTGTRAVMVDANGVLSAP